MLNDRPTIFGMRLHRQQYADKPTRGTRAYFDLDISGIKFTGCILRLNTKMAVKWHPPIDATHPERKIGISFDPELYDGVLEAALQAYRSLGGKGLEREC